MKEHLQDSMEILRLSGFTIDSDCGGKVYTKGESTEDQCKDGGPGSGIKGHTTSRSGYKMEDPKDIEAAIKKVKESGHPDPYYLSGLERALEIAKQERGMKDDDATEMGTFEQLGQNHETEAMEPSDNPVQAQDDEVGEKFKTVMEEFGKGELKSSSGETVTDPEQAKAIAYSEQREANDGGEGSGIKGHATPEAEIDKIEDPKLRATMHGLWQAIKSGKKPQYDPYPEKTLSQSLEEERADINKHHPDFKTPKLNGEITEAKKKEAKDSDPKVAEAKKLIDLFGGAM